MIDDAMVERAADAMERHMFAPHELPLPADLHEKYLDNAKGALLAALGESHVVGLLNFFAWAMRRGPWEGGDLDGGGIQDKAESLGLIVKEPYDPAKHGEYIDCEVGDDLFVFAPAIKAMIAAVTSPDRGESA